MKGFLKNSDLQVLIDSNEKFPEDCLEFETDSWSVKTQGYFLNEEKLLDAFDKNNINELLVHMLNEGICIPEVLFGTYCIYACRKEDNRVLIYNDLLSKKSVFYGETDGGVYFSNSFFEAVALAKEHGGKLTPDSLGIKMLSHYNIFIDDLTYVREIRFLRPFEYILVENGRLQIRKADVPATAQNLEKATVIDQLDAYFSEGVQLQYEKNKKSGYRQVVTLSGGMDSRTTFLYGLRHGYNDTLCFTYAEAGSVDFLVPQYIADDTNQKFFYHSMTNGEFLKNPDAMSERIEGQMGYCGTTGLYDCLQALKTDDWGVVHTGLGGGEIMGDLCKPDQELAWGAFENSVPMNEEECERFLEIKAKYRNYNEFANLNDIRRCLASQKMASRHCEYASPFLYEPFFKLMLAVPYEWKKGRQIYLEWLETKCPCDYPSTFRLGAKTKLGYFVKRVYHHIVVRLGGKTKYDMNPYQNWERENPGLLEHMEELFAQDMKALSGELDEQYLAYFRQEWMHRNLRMKMLLLTASWALQRIFSAD